MNTKRTIRILWLLNNTTLRRLELQQLARLGISEVFVPKSSPDDKDGLSASGDDSFDKFLTIPKVALDILNEQNWYDEPSEEAWEIANQYFDIAFIGLFRYQILATLIHFDHSIVLRAFGFTHGYTCTGNLYALIGVYGMQKIQKIKHRFWFGEGSPHFHKTEDSLLKSRNCYFPVGLDDITVSDEWVGNCLRILFICPRIKTSVYFESLYNEFKENFKQFDYTIGGTQPLPVPDHNVLGFISKEENQLIMKSHRVMFYHSTEQNLIHYHPFEAIKAGMPLVFMAGGMLDTLGGIGLWGRCQNIKEAVSKIKIIMNADISLIKKIKKEQEHLLNRMSPNYWLPCFEKAFDNILQTAEDAKPAAKLISAYKKRIAVILPPHFTNEILFSAVSMANGLLEGSQVIRDDVEVVFAYCDMAGNYQDHNFPLLSPRVKRRRYDWQVLSQESAKNSMHFAGYDDWVPLCQNYYVPDDGINHLLDCDLWIFTSDQIEYPLLPIRPYLLMVYDYYDRHQDKSNQIAQAALRLLVLTDQTKVDAMHYMGIEERQICKIPILIPRFDSHLVKRTEINKSQFFLCKIRKNERLDQNFILALHHYYENLSGQLSCHITGIDQSELFELCPDMKELYANSRRMKEYVQFSGEVTSMVEQTKLAQASFLLNMSVSDISFVSLVQAAQMSVPSLTYDTLNMRELISSFDLAVKLFNTQDIYAFAHELKEIETNYAAFTKNIVEHNNQIEYVTDEHAEFWRLIKKCL